MKSVGPQHPSAQDEQLVRGYEGRMLLTLSLVTMCSMGGRFLLPPLIPSIIQDLSITPTVAGLALTLMWGVAAASHYPGGRTSDELNRKVVLVPSILLIVLGLTSLTVVTTVVGFFVGVIALGVGSGLFTPAAFAQISDLFVHRRGQAFGIQTASVNLGGLLGAGLAIVGLQYVDWRLSFSPLFIILIGVVVLVHHNNNQNYTVAQPKLNVRKTFRRLVKTSQLRWALGTAAVFGFAWQAILSFLPTYLQVSKALSPTVGSIAFGMFFVVGMVVTPLAGRVGDAWTHPNTFILSILIAT
ncbi:MAG: MFS transporter, partial [Halobacteriaceae archaeon]